MTQALYTHVNNKIIKKTKFQPQITFTPHGEATLSFGWPIVKVLALTASKSEEWWLFVPQEPLKPLELPFPDVLGVWAEENPLGIARHMLPAVVELWLGATLSRQQQYPLPHQAQLGIQKHLDWVLKYGILKACQSHGTRNSYQSESLGQMTTGLFKT
jgi:hypothetical protein